MSLGVLGKFLIAVSLCFQAYILFEDNNTITLFNKQLQVVIAHCDCITHDVAILLQQYLRYVLVGLLGMSALMVVTRSIVPKFFVLVGLVSLLLIKHHPIKHIPRLDNIQFWESIAIVGGIIYLMGADVAVKASPEKDKEKVKKE